MEPKKDIKIGLTLCKFAPYHIGHQYLLDSALAIVDKLIVVVYDCPDRIDVPLNVRAGWVRTLYPQIDVIEGWDAPNEHEDTDEVKRRQEQYIFGLLKGQKISHFISSEYYGEHMSKFLNAENVLIDMDRAKINISSTMIRKDPYLYRDFVPSLVLRDLITKVVVLGAPSHVTEKIVSLAASELGTTHVSDTAVQYFSSQSPKTPNMRKISQDRKTERDLDTTIHQAKKSIIYSSSYLDDHVLSMAINREYLPSVHDLARKEIAQFELVFINNDDNNLISQKYGVKNIFLMNQLIGNLKETKTEYIILEGTEQQKVTTIVEATHKHINSKKFS